MDAYTDERRRQIVASAREQFFPQIEQHIARFAGLMERLSGTECIVVTDLIDIRERLKLAGADGVIFFESYDATRFPALNEELQLTERAGVRVLGRVFQ